MTKHTVVALSLFIATTALAQSRVAGGPAVDGCPGGQTMSVAGLAVSGSTIYVSDAADATQTAPLRGRVFKVTQSPSPPNLHALVSGGIGRPGSIALSPTGDVYVAVVDGAQLKIVKVGGSTIATMSGSAIRIAWCRNGLVISDQSAQALKFIDVNAPSTVTSIVTGLKFPQGVACGDDGVSIYAAELTGNDIVKVASDGTKSVVISALVQPVAVSQFAGTLYIYESNQNVSPRVRTVDLATAVQGTLTTGIGMTSIAVGPAGLYYGTSDGVYLKQLASGPTPVPLPTCNVPCI